MSPRADRPDVSDRTAEDALADLPESWSVWNAETEGRVILAYRPDVFDADAFPAACLPTLYVTNRSQRDRPEAARVRTDEWHVVLYLEPEVEVETTTFPDRPAALAGAVDLAARFAGGGVDYRSAYQVPREAYLDELDDLTG